MADKKEIDELLDRLLEGRSAEEVVDGELLADPTHRIEFENRVGSRLPYEDCTRGRYRELDRRPAGRLAEREVNTLSVRGRLDVDPSLSLRHIVAGRLNDGVVGQEPAAGAVKLSLRQ